MHSTPKFSVNLNGELTWFFGSSRGLRQGDPISSYLFVIVLDALSMLIQQRVEDNSLGNYPFEYHWRCKSTKLTHLAFADDLLMFRGKSIPSVKILNQAQQDFSHLSGFLPNRQKSGIYISGSSFGFKQEVQSIL